MQKESLTGQTRQFSIFILTMVAAVLVSLILAPCASVYARSGRTKNTKIAEKKEKEKMGPVSSLRDPVLLKRFRMPPGTESMIFEAIKKKIVEDGKTSDQATLDYYAQRVKTTPDLRRQVAVYLVIVAFEALKSGGRNEAEKKFYRYFQAYYSALERQIAEITLRAWTFHKNQFRNPETPENSPGGLSNLLETGPTLENFEPPDNTLDIGEKGSNEIAEAIYPLINEVYPEVDLKPDESDISMATLLRAVGYGVSDLSFLIILTPFGKKVSDSLLNLPAKTKKKNADIRKKEVAQLKENIVESTEDVTDHMKATKTSKAVGKNTSKLAQKLVKSAAGKQLLKLVNTLKTVIKTIVKEIAKLAAKVGGQIAGRALGMAFGILGIIPAIVESILAAVQLKKAITFEESLHESIKDRSLPDLKEMLNVSMVRNGQLCYARCKPGYTGEGFRCLKDCDAGYTNGPYTCQKINVIQKDVYSREGGTRPERDSYRRGVGTRPERDSYRRGVGTRPERDSYRRGTGTRPKYDRRTRQRTCPAGKVKEGGLCYTKCRSGYSGSGVTCRQNSSTCPAGKVKEGGLCYTKCRSGYSGSGAICRQNSATCPAGTVNEGGLCYQSCRSGYSGSGVTCRENSATCPAGMVNEGGLCYPSCKSGYKGVGTRCRQTTCPAGYKDQGTSCRKIGGKPEIVAKTGYRRGIGQTGDCVTADTRETNKLAIITYLIKNFVADPVDPPAEIFAMKYPQSVFLRAGKTD